VVRLENRVHVMSDLAGAVWVDWQTPAPDLLAVADEDLDAYELPARFKLPLAARGAALLAADDDPLKAAALRALAETELTKQTVRLTRPWWRRSTQNLLWQWQPQPQC